MSQAPETPTPATPGELMFDWSHHGRHRFQLPEQAVTINDETLRDGLQNASVTDPPIEAKLQLVHHMEALGIESASMGLPCAGPQHRETILRLCREISEQRMNLRPNCGGRTVRSDVEAIIDIAQASGTVVEACLFIGSSPIRQYAEDWDIDLLLRHTEESVALAAGEGLEVTFITEDTVRSTPQHLERLLRTAVEAGATRVCLCDTAGSEIPAGTANLVEWVAELLRSIDRNIGIDWHGHRDRGLGMANTLAAIEAGASRIHGTALGIGERVGNAATEEILVNLVLLGLRQPTRLDQLPQYIEATAAALGVEVPTSSPIVGRDAFRTATGVHAAAVIKARDRGEDWLADRIYSGVPASWLGRHQEIEIGPLSGKSNVIHFLRHHDMAEDTDLIDAVLARAKQAKRVLKTAEVLAMARQSGVQRER